MAFRFKDNDDENEIMAEINMTPLIDIMLVLLILFMVTSSVSLESGLDIDLPEVQQAGASKEEGSAVIVSLQANGKIAVQGEPVSFAMLEESIRKALVQEKTEMVILEGDQKSKLGNAVEVMDIAKSAGAKNFGIAAESTEN